MKIVKQIEEIKKRAEELPVGFLLCLLPVILVLSVTVSPITALLRILFTLLKMTFQIVVGTPVLLGLVIFIVLSKIGKQLQS